ncbi:MAG TPA: DHA2 family efflux MFS transporter permease subunit [Thermoleophilia bacterium]|nr:DHA2 family efflux MFS transporter permease subunit [Thermoleophilia bacterium]
MSPPSGSARSWWILSGLTFISFFLLLGDTALSVALPSARAELGVGLTGLQWVVNSYTLSLAALLLLAGRLSDVFGARRVFLTGLSVFAVASLAAGLSPSLAPLLVSRVAQGAGAALMTPAALAIIVSVFPASRRAPALGIWAGVSTAALAMGPVVGAALTESLGWNWLFLVNVPVGIAGLSIGRTLLPASPPESGGSRVDILGILTSGLGLAAVLYALTQASALAWTSPVLLGSLTVGSVSLLLFVIIERRSRQPLLDFSLFRRPNLAAANVVGLLSTAVMCGVFFFMSLYLQLILGYSPLAAGAAFLPLTVPLVLVAPLAGRLNQRVGPRIPVALGLGLLSLSLLVLSRAITGGSLWFIMAAFLLAGVGVGLSTTPVTASALEAVPSWQAGLGSAVLNASRTVGLALGIALMGALVSMDRAGRFGVLVPGFAAGLSMGLLVSAALAGATAVFALLLLRGPSPPGALGLRHGAWAGETDCREPVGEKRCGGGEKRSRQPARARLWYRKA